MQDPPSLSNGFHREHAQRLVSSFRALLQRELAWPGRAPGHDDPAAPSGDADKAEALFHAPYVVVSHGMQQDPIFNYGNRRALELFEMSWPEFTALPSRKSAEPVNRAERARLLDAVTKQGYIDDYAGIRVSASGKRFYIPQAIVWNVFDESGSQVGQAATFSQWDFL